MTPSIRSYGLLSSGRLLILIRKHTSAMVKTRESIMTEQSIEQQDALLSHAEPKIGNCIGNGGGGGKVNGNGTGNGDYGEQNIQILEGLEAVRVRPGMYIGATDQRGLRHLIYVVVDNSNGEVRQR